MWLEKCFIAMKCQNQGGGLIWRERRFQESELKVVVAGGGGGSIIIVK